MTSNPSKTSAESFYISPLEVNVKDGLPRFRKELGAVEDLAESLQKFGQMQPIVINRSKELIAGGRRLAACLHAGIDALVIYNDTVDPIIMREMEVEENVQRKAFTPAEEVTAIKALHELKQEIYGESASGKAGGWTLDKTASAVGKTRGTVIEAIALAEALQNFPELSQCKTKSEIKKAVGTIERTMTRAAAATEYDNIVKVAHLPVEFTHANALDFMPTIAEHSVDLLLADPPYGMDVFSSLDSFVSRTIGKGGFTYDDDADKALVLYQALAVEAFRFTKADAHAYVFCCPEHFPKIQNYFREAGWQVHIRPLIWVKKTSGQNNAPYHWPSSCYEMVLYARKVDSRLVKPGLADWFQYEPVVDSTKVHQAQKPVPLLRDIISRSVFPNSKVVDPFAGSASTLIAALEEKCQAIGCELGQEAYDAGRSQIINYQKELEQRP
jgi:site-specific DNA-methyltransferase (adenine-specific)